MTQKKILLAVAIASTGMIFATGCARKDDAKKSPSAAPQVAPVTTQESARANILSSGNQLIEKRAAIVRDSDIATHEAIRNQKLELLKQEYAAAEAAVAEAGNDENKRNTAETKRKQVVADQEGYTDAAGRPVVGSKQVTLNAFDTASKVANDVYAATVKKETDAYATAVSIAFGGGKKNKDGSYQAGQEPAELVTPIMADHEFVALLAGNEKSLSDSIKAINENEGLTDEQKTTDINKAKLNWAGNESTALVLFNRAVRNVKAFRDTVEAYRLAEINSGEHAEHFAINADQDEALSKESKANDYLVANFEGLSSVVIGSTVLFSEMTQDSLPTSRCLDVKGCGTVENAIVGTNTADAVKARIEAILKARQDAPFIDAIRKHLSKTLDGSNPAPLAEAKVMSNGVTVNTVGQEIVETIITRLPSTDHSWETLANAITGVEIYKIRILVKATQKTSETDPRTTFEVLDLSVLRGYFVK